MFNTEAWKQFNAITETLKTTTATADQKEEFWNAAARVWNEDIAGDVTTVSGQTTTIPTFTI